MGIPDSDVRMSAEASSELETVPTRFAQLPQKRNGVQFRAVPDGAVLYSKEHEVYYGLNQVGTEVWGLLPPVTSTMDELCEKLTAIYSDVGVDVIRADVEEMLQELVSHGLLIPVTQNLWQDRP
jgi:Coenzyme PQQ synthesis protein D (PqqD)